MQKKKKLICALFQAKIQTIQGYARFINDAEPTVEVNGRKYTAPHILIATGGQPSVLSNAEVPGKTCYTLFYQWASVRCVEDYSCCVCWQFQGQAWALPVMASLNLKHCQSKLVIHTDVNGRPSEPCRSVIIVFVCFFLQTQFGCGCWLYCSGDGGHSFHLRVQNIPHYSTDGSKKNDNTESQYDCF